MVMAVHPNDFAQSEAASLADHLTTYRAGLTGDNATAK
jgi:hypothetical protein